MSTTTDNITTKFDINVAKRLKQFRMKYIDKVQGRAAVKLKESQGALWEMENGKREIKPALVKKLSKEFQLNTEWLYNNTGKDVTSEVPKKQLITDINSLLFEFTHLEKQLKIVNLTVDHLMKRIEQQEKEIELLRKEISSKK